MLAATVAVLASNASRSCGTSTATTPPPNGPRKPPMYRGSVPGPRWRTGDQPTSRRAEWPGGSRLGSVGRDRSADLRARLGGRRWAEDRVECVPDRAQRRVADRERERVRAHDAGV